MSKKLDDCLKKHGIDPNSIYCGADCGDGWVPLIDELITDLIALGWDKKIAQIKEKFGILAWYIDSVYEEEEESKYQAIYERIQQATNQSAVTCEECGEPGKSNSNPKVKWIWIKTLCNKCNIINEEKQSGSDFNS